MDKVLIAQTTPCKPGEILTPDGRCLFPTCPPGQVYDYDGAFCFVPLPECQPGRPCSTEQLAAARVPCKPSEVFVNGRCLLPEPLKNLTCKPVQLQIEPACLQAEGCTPEPGVAFAMLLTVVMSCMK